MNKLLSPRSFALICGSILFLFGIVGFSFRSSFDLGTQYLIFSLALGFWGVVAAVGSQGSR